MNELALGLSVAAAVLAVWHAIQTLIATRKKYYDDYLKEKRRRSNA